jgi:adenylate kinase family enzyme
MGRVQRVSVVGNSGSGKTTMARALAAAIGAPFLELDSIYHQPGWAELETQEYRRRVAEFVAAGSWVVDGNYSKVRDLIWDRADTVAWVDPPRHRVMRQVIWRSLSRAARRTELWNGNRERWGNFLTLKPEESIIVWAWTRHSVYRSRYLEAQADPALSHLRFVRLQSPRQVADFIRAAGLSGPAGRPPPPHPR